MSKRGVRCEACYGFGLTDNHVTGEICCSACDGTGWEKLPIVDTGDELHQVLGEALRLSVPLPISSPEGNSK